MGWPPPGWAPGDPPLPTAMARAPQQGYFSLDPRAYEREMARAQLEVGRLPEDVMRQLLGELGEIRHILAMELHGIPADTGDMWGPFHARALEGAIGVATSELAKRYEKQLGTAVSRAIQAGSTAMPRALAASGADPVSALGLQLPAVFTHQLEAAAARRNASLIQAIDLRSRKIISRKMRNLVAGFAPARKVQQEILRSLDVPQRPTSRFGGLMYQAYRIVVTESGQLFELAKSAQAERAMAELGGDDWVTYWVHSGQAEEAGARGAHIALHGTSVKAGEFFDVNGHKAAGPHDPGLPVEEVAFCRCTKVLWRESWGPFVPGFPPGSDMDRAPTPDVRAKLEELDLHGRRHQREKLQRELLQKLGVAQKPMPEKPRRPRLVQGVPVRQEPTAVPGLPERGIDLARRIADLEQQPEYKARFRELRQPVLEAQRALREYVEANPKILDSTEMRNLKEKIKDLRERMDWHLDSRRFAHQMIADALRVEQPLDLIGGRPIKVSAAGVTATPSQRRMGYTDRDVQQEYRDLQRERIREALEWVGGLIDRRRLSPELLKRFEDMPLKTDVKSGGGGRSSYGWNGVLELAQDADQRAVAHEAGHYIEDVLADRGIFPPIADFLRRRTQGSVVERLNTVAGFAGYRPDEIFLRDAFVDLYVGKIYTGLQVTQARMVGLPHDRATDGSVHKLVASEVLSMGLDWLWKDPQAFAVQDPEHFGLIIDILTGRAMAPELKEWVLAEHKTGHDERDHGRRRGGGGDLAPGELDPSQVRDLGGSIHTKVRQGMAVDDDAGRALRAAGKIEAATKHSMMVAVAAQAGVSIEDVARVDEAWNDYVGAGFLALQRAVVAEMGVPTTPWQQAQFEATDSLPARPTGLPDEATTRRVVRGMYEVTQRELKRQGVESIELVRGADLPAAEQPQEGEVVELLSNAAESWTTRPATAEMFGNTVFHARVPAERILSLFSTGVGNFGEQEVVVLGGAGRVRVMRGKP